MLSFMQVVKQFDGRTALDHVDLRIDEGKTTVLVGPSGCGKSTLLRLAVGLLVPDAGHVEIVGMQLDRKNANAIRHRIGYVIQEGGLFPHLSVRENLSLMPGVLKWSRDRTKQRIAELAGLTRFPMDAVDRPPSRLSGGQRQRVSLIRALMLDPPLLLLDEPLGALDPVIRHELQDELREIFHRLHKTVVLVTHDLAEAGFFGDTIALMRDGRILQKGPLADLIEHPMDPYVTQFIQAQRTPWESYRPCASQAG